MNIKDALYMDINTYVNKILYMDKNQVNYIKY